MEEQGVPLAAEDRAILALECETVAGHTCKVIEVAREAPGVAALRERLGERIGAAPELSRRLGGSREEPCWVPDEGFDVAAHVRPVQVDAPLDRDGLVERVATLFATRLDRDRPLWRLDVAPLADGGQALIWRIHHAVADGTASMRLLRELLWDHGESGARQGAPASNPPPVAAAGAGAATGPAIADRAADDARRRSHLAAFIERELGESLHGSPFDGAIGTRRRIALAAVPLPELHDAAKRVAGATLNDAVLSVVAGALRHWIEAHHGSLTDVRVRVPVSLHHEGDAAANRDSFFALPLPLHIADPVERLALISEETTVRKREHDAERIDSLLHRAERISPRLGRFVERIESSPRRFAVSVSNVVGPRQPVTIDGAAVRGMHSIAEIGRRHGLRVSVVSLAGTLYFGFCADPHLVDDLEAMATGVETEAARLIDAGR